MPTSVADLDTPAVVIDLDIVEANIARAQDWALGRRRDPLTEKFIMDLHKRMLGDVWKWAGKFRKTERNIGIESYRIEPEFRQILDDARYWVEHQTYSPDELAVRLHHRLVLVHPFPNGNGRWSRLTADVLVTQFGGPRFTWGSANLQAASEIRSAYIKALHAADEHDLVPLVDFARS